MMPIVVNHTMYVLSPQYVFEDSMDLIAKLTPLAAAIYRNSYRDGKVGAIDPNKDWAANFCSMLAYDDPSFTGECRNKMW